jgi:hypothetical protein
MKRLISAIAFCLFMSTAYTQNSYSVKIEEDYTKPNSSMWEAGDEFYTGTIENGMYVSKAEKMHAQLKFDYSLYDRQGSCISSSDMEYTIVKLKGNKESFMCVQIDPDGDEAYPYLVFQYNELGDWTLTNYRQDKTYSSGKTTVNPGTTANVIRIEHRYNKVMYYVNAVKVTELKSDNQLVIRWYNNKIYSKDKKFVIGLDKALLGGCVTDKEELIKQEKRKEEEANKLLSENVVLYRYADWTLNKYGFSDADGKIIIPIKYDEVKQGDAHACFSEGLAAVKLNGKWGFINKAGKEVVELKYDYVHDFENGFAVVSMFNYPNTLHGLVNKTGKEIIAPTNKYSFATKTIAEGMMAMDNSNGLFGFADTNGVQIIAPKYEEVKRFSDGMAAVKMNGKWGFIDKTGKEVVPAKYDFVDYFSEGFCVVNIGGNDEGTFADGGKYGFIDKTGKQITELKYYWAYPFAGGLALVIEKEGGAYEFIDPAGKTVLSLTKYSAVNSFAEGLAVVHLNVEVPGEDFPITKSGCIDKTGKEIIPLTTDFFIWDEYFSEGLIAATNEKMSIGYIDKTGKVVIPYQYKSAEPFKNGRARVKIGDKVFYIDKTGKELK